MKCVTCGKETNRAKNSQLELEIDGLGPFCEECWDKIRQKCTEESKGIIKYLKNILKENNIDSLL